MKSIANNYYGKSAAQFRNLYKFRHSLIFAFSVIFIFSMTSGCKNIDSSTRAPEFWYRLPENLGPSAKDSGNSSAESFQQFVEQTFDLQAQTMNEWAENSPLLGKSTEAKNHPKDWVPWRLAMISTDFGLSTNGFFGALVGGGSTLIKCFWRPLKEVQNTTEAMTPGVQETNSTSNGTSINIALNDPEQLDLSLRNALSRREITDPKAFRKNIADLAKQFHEIPLALESFRSQQSLFEPEEFKIEIEVNGSGQVTPAISAGGTMSLKFIWKAQEKQARHPTPAEAKLHKPKVLSSLVANNLVKFIKAVGPDLDSVYSSTSMIEKKGFQLSEIKMGLILSADYQFAIASLGGQTMAAIVFARKENSLRQTVVDSDITSLQENISAAPLLLVKNSSADLERFAITQSLATFPQPQSPVTTFTPLLTGAPGEKSAFEIPHRRFQNGLKKAVRMASLFIGAAKIKKKSRWAISALQPEFQLSISGTTGLATLGVGAELEMTFERISWSIP